MDIRGFRCYIFADWPYKDTVSYSYTLYICIRRIIHWPPKKLSIAVSGHSVCHIVCVSRCLTLFVCTTPDSSSRSVWILAACRKSAHLSFRVPIMCRIFQLWKHSKYFTVDTISVRQLPYSHLNFV